MSLTMCFRFVEDADIELFRTRPALLAASLGTLAWAGSGVDHRNVRAAHYILNGTERPVAGAGRLYQTWFDPLRCGDLEIKHVNSAFALGSAQVGELMAILDGLTEEVIAQRTRELAGPDDDDPSYWNETFEELRCICEQALAGKRGLLWTTG